MVRYLFNPENMIGSLSLSIIDQEFPTPSPKKLCSLLSLNQ